MITKCIIPKLNCIIIAFTSLLYCFCFACQPLFFFLITASSCIIFIQIITPFLINSTIIESLYVFAWLATGGGCTCVCVCLCVHPVLLPLSLKSVEDQTDNMKCSGMDETGNNQVLFLMNFCSWCCSGMGC